MTAQALANLKMKDLAARTGVSREAIHFYLREGLLPEPQRPKRNVAYYSEEHVVRLQVIKRLQEEHNLPLREIKRRLADADFQALTPGDDLAAFEYLFLSLINGDLPSGDRSLADVAADTGFTQAEIEDLAQRGVVHLRGGRLDFRDVGILRSWAKMREVGYTNDAGYDAAYLSRYEALTRELAELEVTRFLASFASLPSDAAAEQASVGIEIANELITRLHVRALADVLRERVRESGPS